MDDIDTAIVSISISNPTRFFVPDVSMMSLCVCVCVYSGLAAGEFSSIVLDWQYGQSRMCFHLFPSVVEIIVLDMYLQLVVILYSTKTRIKYKKNLHSIQRGKYSQMVQSIPKNQ